MIVITMTAFGLINPVLVGCRVEAVVEIRWKWRLDGKFLALYQLRR